MNLGNANVNLNLSSLTVAQKTGGPGGIFAQFNGGGSGSIVIGSPNAPGDWYVANTINGGGTQGVVDFSGLGSLTANLNVLSLGTAITGSAQATVTLAASNRITANNIIVGSDGGSSNTLTLGASNTILANQLTIAQGYASSTVQVPSGGTLMLGSPSQRTSLSIATGQTNTNSTYSGVLDATNATVVAYLDNVVIGNKDMEPGRESGTLTIGTHSNNYINANSITLGGNQSNGTLNFGGGKLVAGTIAPGTGSPVFNWTGGQLSVGSFGTPAMAFNLNNTGTGTLAPSPAAGVVGTTNIYGNYIQGSAASMAINIAGSSPSSGNDLVNVSGTASLGGTLLLSTSPGFVPSVGQNYQIATYASHSGAFDFVAPPQLPQNVAFQLDTSPKQLLVHMVAPVPQNWIATTSGSLSTPGNWDTNTTPGTASSLAISNSAAAAQTVTVATSTTVHRISLQSNSGPLSLDVPEGIRLGVANQLVVGPNSTLEGGGQIFGNVVLAGGTISPGVASAPISTAATSARAAHTLLASPSASMGGLLTFAGGLTLEPNSVLNFALGSRADEIRITQGMFTGPGNGAVMVNLAEAGGFQPGQTYTLIDFTGATASNLTTSDFVANSGPVSGAFALEGSTLQFTTAVPEPASLAMLLLSGAVPRRRRRLGA